MALSIPKPVRPIALGTLVVTVLGLGLSASNLAAHRASASAASPYDYCEHHPANCTEPSKTEQPVGDYYIGHDEPS
jgi:hypothetical protein